MVSRDVITQNCKRTHVGQSTWCSQRPFPIRRTTNVSTHRTPVVKWAFRLLNFTEVKHRNVDFTELFRLHSFFYQCIDFSIRWPDIFQVNWITVFVCTQCIFFDVKTNCPCNRIRDHKWRRCQERLFCIRMDTTIEVTVTRKYRCRIQITVNDFLLNHWIKRT